MAISQDSYDFGGAKLNHGAASLMPVDVSVQVMRVAGINGESHLADQPKGRELVVEGYLRNYSSLQLLTDDLDEIDDNAGQLNGTVTITGDAALTAPRMTFMGREVIQPPRYDGSGQHGWFCKIRLKWTQRRI